MLGYCSAEEETSQLHETPPPYDALSASIGERDGVRCRKFYFDGGQVEIAADLVYELDAARRPHEEAASRVLRLLRPGSPRNSERPAREIRHRRRTPIHAARRAESPAHFSARERGRNCPSFRWTGSTWQRR